MTELPNLSRLPDGLVAPSDDGAARHLPGLPLPALSLPSTAGGLVDLAALPAARTVIYAYPMTGEPGVALPPGWDEVPGARGCTIEACSFRDHRAELAALGAEVFGLSTQTTEYQRRMAERLYLPFAVLSDGELRLARALRLPTMEVGGMTLLRRLTLIVRAGRIEHAIYPVFPPDQAAGEVLGWLRANPLARRPAAAER